MHICKSSGNCTGKTEKKSISQNKEYHDNAKVKKLAVGLFRNKMFKLRNRSTIHISQHSVANFSNPVYTFVKNNIFDN